MFDVIAEIFPHLFVAKAKSLLTNMPWHIQMNIHEAILGYLLVS